MKLTDGFKSESGIYIITNIKNGKKYIGETLNIKNRIYQHSRSSSSQTIHKAIRKYSIEDFNVEVCYLPNAPKFYLIKLERRLIESLNSLSPNGYNVCPEGNDNTGTKLSEETKLKISNSGKGRTVTQETREKISKSHKGKIVSKETGKRISEAKRGKPGKKLSESGKEKVRQARLGSSLSEETKKKLSEINKGKTHSQESRERMSLVQKNRREKERLTKTG